MWKELSTDVKEYKGLETDVEELRLRSGKTQKRMTRDGSDTSDYLHVREDLLKVMRDLNKLIELQKYINIEKSERKWVDKPEACYDLYFQSNPAFQAFRHLWEEAEEDDYWDNYCVWCDPCKPSCTMCNRDDNQSTVDDDDDDMKPHSHKEEDEVEETREEEEEEEKLEQSEEVTKKVSE